MKAHEFLTSAEVWWQESPAKDAQGNKLQANDPRAVKWCALGVIQKLYPPSQRSEVIDQVLRALSISEEGISQLTATDKACCLMEWNDDRQTTFEKVKNILSSADI